MTRKLHTKLLLKLGLAAALPFAAAGAAFEHRSETEQASVATVTIAAGEFSYRMAGDFSRGGVPANGPVVRHRLTSPLVMMKAQVSAADYEACVRDRGCRPLGRHDAARAELPVVGVSWEDATAYAKWLSAKTGQTWRLPTDAEWAFAAASRVADDAIVGASGSDFSQRWLAKYEQESARDRTVDRRPKPFGTFGSNENGLLDLAGNVWEWTDTCFMRQSLDGEARPVGEPLVNCGVRVVQGQHRTYVSNFIRDARAGGCSVGAPPANLGFRLVREETPGFLQRVASVLRRMTMAA